MWLNHQSTGNTAAWCRTLLLGRTAKMALMNKLAFWAAKEKRYLAFSVAVTLPALGVLTLLLLQNWGAYAFLAFSAAIAAPVAFVYSDYKRLLAPAIIFGIVMAGFTLAGIILSLAEYGSYFDSWLAAFGFGSLLIFPLFAAVYAGLLFVPCFMVFKMVRLFRRRSG